MVETFNDLESQISFELKMRYQILDVVNKQTYYSNSYEQILKIYDLIPSAKVMYEVVEIKKGIKKMRKIKSYSAKLF